MEGIADHCASDVLMGGCETSAFFYGRDNPKDNGAIPGLFISWERLKKELETTIKDNEKGVRISSNPF